MRKSLLLLGTVGALAAAPSALAADRTGTVSATSPTFAWDGGPGTSYGVNTGVVGGASVGNFAGCFEGIADCEDTLLKVEAPGKLTLIADSADDANDVLDMYLYETNEAGEFDNQDTDMAEGGGAGTTGDEKIEAQVQPGYYMVHIKFFLADGDTYKGTATLSGFPAPMTPVTPAPAAPTTSEPAPAASQPPAQTEPAAQTQAPAKKKKASKKKACKKKAKKIKNKGKRKKALKKCAKRKR